LFVFVQFRYSRLKFVNTTEAARRLACALVGFREERGVLRKTCSDVGALTALLSLRVESSMPVATSSRVSGSKFIVVSHALPVHIGDGLRVT
jgi:hypothetical protein